MQTAWLGASFYTPVEMGWIGTPEFNDHEVCPITCPYSVYV